MLNDRLHSLNPGRRAAPRRCAARVGNQRGVALMVALVMLVIIGFMSVAVMRGALSADTVANNTRTRNFALQSAQVALGYCERRILDPSFSANIQPLSGSGQADLWGQFSSWEGASKKAFEIPRDVLRSSDSSIATDVRTPECLVEQIAGSGGKWYVTTARGFSPDYAPDSSGNATAGSAVWLQSTMLFK